MAMPVLAAGHIPTAAELKQITDRIDLLSAPPRAHLRQTVAQTVSNGVFTAITYDAEDFDNYAGHSTASNTDRYTCMLAGWYMLNGAIGWAASASTTTQRGSSWYKNGSQLNASQLLFTPSVNATMQFPARTMFVQLAVADYVELRAFQNTGGNLNTDVSFSGLQSSASIIWIGEA